MIAGIDLGCNTGFAVIDATGRRVFSVTWHLGKRGGRSLLQLEQYFYIHFAQYCVEIVGYEAVKQPHKSRPAAAAYGAFEGLLQKICEELNLPLIQIGVQEVKRLCSVPRPEKDDMEALVLKKFGHLTEDDNEADALLVAECVRIRIVGQKALQ